MSIEPIHRDGTTLTPDDGAWRPRRGTVVLASPRPEAAIPFIAALAAAPTSRFRLRLAGGLHDLLDRLAAEAGDAVLFDTACGDLRTAAHRLAEVAPGTALVALTTMSEGPTAWDVPYVDDHLVSGHVTPDLVERVVRHAVDRRRLLTHLSALSARAASEDCGRGSFHANESCRHRAVSRPGTRPDPTTNRQGVTER